MYLDDEVRAIVSRLDRMWIELRAGFNMHVMYARKEMPYNKHMEQAYEKAFGLNISDELKEMESIVEKRMQAINDKVQNMIQGQ